MGVFGEPEGWLLILGLAWAAALVALQIGYRNLTRME
jgi:hypothetical protein